MWWWAEVSASGTRSSGTIIFAMRARHSARRPHRTACRTRAVTLLRQPDIVGRDARALGRRLAALRPMAAVVAHSVAGATACAISRPLLRKSRRKGALEYEGRTCEEAGFAAACEHTLTCASAGALVGFGTYWHGRALGEVRHPWLRLGVCPTSTGSAWHRWSCM